MGQTPHPVGLESCLRDYRTKFIQGTNIIMIALQSSMFVEQLAFASTGIEPIVSKDLLGLLDS